MNESFIMTEIYTSKYVQKLLLQFRLLENSQIQYPELSSEKRGSETWHCDNVVSHHTMIHVTLLTLMSPSPLTSLIWDYTLRIEQYILKQCEIGTLLSLIEV